MSSASAEKVQNPTFTALLNSDLLKAASTDTSLSKRDKLITQRCTTIKTYLGFTETVIGQALKYSCSASAVGVVFYAGNDLGKHSPEKIADYIQTEFAKNGVHAKVFIHKQPKQGSNISYLFRGGREVMNPKEPFSAIKSIEEFVANMKLVYLKDELISTTELGRWVKSETAYLPELIRTNI